MLTEDEQQRVEQIQRQLEVLALLRNSGMFRVTFSSHELTEIIDAMSELLALVKRLNQKLSEPY